MDELPAKKATAEKKGQVLDMIGHHDLNALKAALIVEAVFENVGVKGRE
jgi:3-hydroxyacyl-CoA dehydrogenase